MIDREAWCTVIHGVAKRWTQLSDQTGLNPTQYWSCWRSCGAQLQYGDPRRSTCLDLPRDLVLKKLSHLKLLGDPPVPGVPGGHHGSTCPGTQFLGGCHVSTCPGIRSPRGCHASACLGICTLISGCLALRLKLQKDSPLRKSTHEN